MPPPALMQQARQAGAHALILRDVALDGAAMKAFTEVLRHGGMRPRVLQSHLRACLDATRDADELLRDALGAEETQRTAPPAQPAGRTRRRRVSMWRARPPKSPPRSRHS